MLIRVTKPAVGTKRGNVCLLPRQLLHFAFEGAPSKLRLGGDFPGRSNLPQPLAISRIEAIRFPETQYDSFPGS